MGTMRENFDAWLDEHSEELPWDPQLRADYRAKKARVEAVESRQTQRTVEKNDAAGHANRNINDPLQDGRDLSEGYADDEKSSGIRGG